MIKLFLYSLKLNTFNSCNSVQAGGAGGKGDVQTEEGLVEETEAWRREEGASKAEEVLLLGEAGDRSRVVRMEVVGSDGRVAVVVEDLVVVGVLEVALK